MTETGTVAALHIEDEEIARNAEELASLLGVSVAEAVTVALREALAHEQEIADQVARMEAAAAEVRETLTKPLPSSDRSWLYDENGLPA